MSIDREAGGGALKDHGLLGVVRAWLDAFNDGERERFRALLAEDVVFVQRPLDREERGGDVVTASFFEWRAGFLGLQGEIRDAFESADRVAAEVVWRGIAKTRRAASLGREVGFPACFLFALREGDIVEIIDYYDRLSFAQQLKP